MRIAAYCDFYTDSIRPLQLIVDIQPGDVDWSETLYLPVSGPFEPFTSEDFGDLPCVSVLLEDLVRPKQEPSEYTTVCEPGTTTSVPSRRVLGIRLPQIAARCGDPSDIQRLVLQMDDATEVLGYERG
ncbi:hypothetical protein U9M73_10765 [Paenibacillus phoenicis]|uniref:Uncharacterized protein n=1 Tax=Paenibacillus phoenicis TaxID=554117 RepID=A0ABU5PKL3_9BACL|nr:MULTISPECIES: hypothetical protein [Paenibacillus]MCT2197415.1 hypothetical protein [Paenibacillus sp. p3-SID1389]MEA3570479.1 hypothetical protein [Paenibacillus phoenicis]